MDGLLERYSRLLARRTGRRTFIARLGALLVGAYGLPLLPVARGASAGFGAGSARASEAEEKANRPAEPAGAAGDPNDCEYWRHCAIDGFLCGCCGGSATSCPPGTEMSPVTWVGTCRNPGDGQDYIISYNDCCGKHFCGRCFCNRNEGERPAYHWYRNNDINWCAGTKTQLYNCSTALVVSVAAEAQPEK